MSLEKPILTITITADLLKLHPRTLMLYEKAKLISPHRTGTNRRLYSKKDLNDLQFVKFLTQQGINLKGVYILLKALSLAEQQGINLQKRLFPDYRSRKLI